MKKITFVLLLSVSSSAFSLGNQIGKVTSIKIRVDGIVKVSIDGPRNEQAACASKPFWVIQDENSVAGKAQLALLMSAQASGRDVVIGAFPTGQCTRDPNNGEDIRNVNSFTE